MSIPKELKHLAIPIQEIYQATDNFSRQNLITGGGFGDVYKGELSRAEGPCTVALKRLDRSWGQGDLEFWTEVSLLSRYRHENLVHLVGFCDENEEKILVYEYQHNGSLDNSISDYAALTWTRRLKICLGVALGLNYLHTGRGLHDRVLHRDIKSSNILLDRNWEAKISDFGLSKLGPANQEFSVFFSRFCGTPGYVDPVYHKNGILTNESDIYSFGVVLFEVLCGKTAYFDPKEDKGVPLAESARLHYEQGNLDMIIDPNLRTQMEPDSLSIFSDIAYRCLNESREKRPQMSQILEALYLALQLQESFEDLEPLNYEEIMKMAEPPMDYGSEEELYLLLSKGILLDEGKTWFSLTNNGQTCEMISAAQFSFQRGVTYRKISTPKSRFSKVAIVPRKGRFTARVRTQFLSRGVTYALFLVFQYYVPQKESRSKELVFTRVRYHEKATKQLTAYIANRREDGWLMTELYQFTSHKKKVALEISFQMDQLNPDSKEKFIIEGIEFRSVENVRREESEQLQDDGTDTEKLLTSGSDADWEEKMPLNFKTVIKRSIDKVPYTSNKELYLLLSKGIFIKEDIKINWNPFHRLLARKSNPKKVLWFWLNENGAKCVMVPFEIVFQEVFWYHVEWISMHDSRFYAAKFYEDLHHLSILYDIKSEILSPNTSYACHLLYKVSEGCKHLENPMLVIDQITRADRIVYFVYPEAPILSLKSYERPHSPVKIPKPRMKGYPKQRNDGWMEVQMWEFTTGTANGATVKMAVHFYPTGEVHGKSGPIWNKIYNEEFAGLIVQGVEVRPT